MGLMARSADVGGSLSVREFDRLPSLEKTYLMLLQALLLRVFNGALYGFYSVWCFNRWTILQRLLLLIGINTPIACLNTLSFLSVIYDG